MPSILMLMKVSKRILIHSSRSQVKAITLKTINSAATLTVFFHSSFLLKGMRAHSLLPSIKTKTDFKYMTAQASA
jgi:hypothetical protein